MHACCYCPVLQRCVSKLRDSILHQICRHISIGEIRRLGGESVGSVFALLGRELPYKGTGAAVVLSSPVAPFSTSGW